MTPFARLSSLWLAGLMLPVAYAQSATTTAVCGSNFDWMDNSRAQSPCLIAAYLQGACGSGTWTVPLLPFTATGAQQSYLPPNGTAMNLCTCSAAVYNLMSACAACQGGGWLLYAPWSLGCESQNMLGLPDSFPPSIPIPSNTTVPEYALVDPRAWFGGGFNISEARGVALGAVPPSYTLTTSSIGTSTPVSSSSMHSETSSATVASSNTSTHQDNTGAIVGGVVGGILGISLVIVLIIWLVYGKRLRQRSLDASSPTGQNLLGRPYAAPAPPPGPPSIVVPIPVRPYPLKNGFQSWMSGSTRASSAGDHHGPQQGQVLSPKPLTQVYTGGVVHTNGPEGTLESGNGGVQFSEGPALRRSNTASSRAQALFRRVTSPLRRHRRGVTVSTISSGTNMTTIPADSESGHGSRNVSRQNTARRIAEPVPYILPSRNEDIPVMDISSGGPVAGQQVSDHGQFYGLSAAEEKRRLNPPAYVIPPVTASARNNSPPQMLERMAPNPSTSLVDLISGGATTGSMSNVGVDPTGHRTPGQPQELHSASRYRPDSDPMSLPSNLILSSPMDIRSQDASSGMLDSSPIATRPVPPSHLRFVVANPSREVEM